MHASACTSMAHHGAGFCCVAMRETRLFLCSYMIGPLWDKMWATVMYAPSAYTIVDSSSEEYLTLSTHYGATSSSQCYCGV
jgi:hypothetical protein